MRINYGNFSRRINATAIGPPFSPLDLTSLWAWYDPGQNVTQSAGLVSVWGDSSGNGRNVGQTTSAFQPAFSSTAMNGLPAITSDRVGGTIKGFSGSYSASAEVSTPVTVIAIFNANTVPGGSEASIVGGDTGGWQFTIGGNNLLAWNKQWMVNIAESIDIAAPGYTIGAGTLDSTSYTFRVNGSASGSGSNPQGNLVAGWLSITCNNANASSTSNFDGSMGDIIIVNAISSLSDIQKAEGFLAWKYNLTSLLPSGHPYKSAAP